MDAHEINDITIGRLNVRTPRSSCFACRWRRLPAAQRVAVLVTDGSFSATAPPLLGATARRAQHHVSAACSVIPDGNESAANGLLSFVGQLRPTIPPAQKRLDFGTNLVTPLCPPMRWS